MPDKSETELNRELRTDIRRAIAVKRVRTAMRWTHRAAIVLGYVWMVRLLGEAWRYVAGLWN